MSTFWIAVGWIGFAFAGWFIGVLMGSWSNKIELQDRLRHKENQVELLDGLLHQTRIEAERGKRLFRAVNNVEYWGAGTYIDKAHPLVRDYLYRPVFELDADDPQHGLEVPTDDAADRT